MIVFSRKVNEVFVIRYEGKEVRVHIADLSSSRVRIAVDAPKEFVVRRVDDGA